MKPKVIYSARIEKESGLKEVATVERAISRPLTSTGYDLISEYLELDEKSAFHARSIRTKADCSVGLGYQLEGDEKVDNSRLDNINTKGQSLSEVIVSVALDFEGCGNGFLEVVRDNGGKVSELYHAPAKEMYVASKKGSFDFYQKVSNGAEEVGFKRFQKDSSATNSIIHFIQPTHKNRHYGLPDWAGCTPDIDLDYYAVQYNKKLFINSGIPDIAIIIEGAALTDEALDDIQNFFRTNIKGIDNAHKTLIMPIEAEGAKVHFEKLALDSKNIDSSFEKLRQRCRDNILSAHGVPPRLAGIVEGGSLGSGSENTGQLQIFQQVIVNPRQVMFEKKLNPVIEAMGLNAKIKFNILSISSDESESTRLVSLVSSGIMTINEARAELGKEPLDEKQQPEIVELSANLYKIRKALEL